MKLHCSHNWECVWSVTVGVLGLRTEDSIWTGSRISPPIVCIYDLNRITSCTETKINLLWINSNIKYNKTLSSPTVRRKSSYHSPVCCSLAHRSQHDLEKGNKIIWITTMDNYLKNKTSGIEKKSSVKRLVCYGHLYFKYTQWKNQECFDKLYWKYSTVIERVN